MPRNQIKFNSRAFHQILNSGGTSHAVHETAYRIAYKAGSGMRVKERHGNFGGGRPIAYVVTHARTPEEAEDQRKRLEGSVY